ncbi:aminotransferase-like domain-containing protein [Desulfovibrio psychrotolerans]|uniref:Aspartate aminotransferase n=1 Tax=Desulfovibrio psychrotolerans TaxID=415242 RepID=A0A7J0BVM9_9BACT|nr:PLP-dependent aminotransferase family protein [Desulfovibrio psychrotolerans]GFM37215.1 aspartate aminotransferase [Desulfovibrio psychrotolerans]
MRTADRMQGVHRSYIREILKVTARPEVISFAGGLPHPDSFPADKVAQAAAHVFAEDGAAALQYSTTEGYEPLRNWIAERYAKQGLAARPDDILITTGSQQALDMVGRALCNRGEPMVIERPGYLGAIQCFSMYGVDFKPVDLLETGVDTGQLDAVLQQTGARFFYAVPNFQNPSGISYDAPTRKAVAEIAGRHGCIVIEDNPYGELRFMGEDLPPVRSYMTTPSILLGSFSKMVAPGMRLGWVYAPDGLMDSLVRAKQACDLHTATLTQRILYRYLADNDVDAHIASIRERYKTHRDLMVAAIREHFPQEVRATDPQGGMFLWCTLPQGLSAEQVFERAIQRNVAFVPGRPFYVDGTDNTFRLNFSNASPEKIEEGIARLGACLRECLHQAQSAA